MKKLFTLLLAVAASIGTLFAWDYERIQIGDLYYNLDATSQTAEVTSQNSDYPKWSTTITTANIPSSVEYNSVTYTVTSIGEWAFWYCTGLTSVTIGNSVTSIGDRAFSNCTGLTSVTIGNSVTSIGYQAFYGCSSLTSVTIPNSVTSIGESAFYDCTGLTSVTIGNSVTSIGSSAFSNCTGLTSVTIPNSVTSIGDRAFAECTGLTSVTIPNSVTSIGEYAFSNCTGLTSVTIPNSVTTIGNYAFHGCTGLTSIVVENGNTVYDSRNDCNAIIETATNTLIVGCPNTIIPNSVTSIGVMAFYYCTGLTSVTIPNSVTSIGGGAFWYCSSLTSINVASDNSNYCSVDGVLFNKDKTTLIQYPGGKQGAYIIPNSVTSIGVIAFYYCTGLTSVTIPNSVTSIGEGAFDGCSGLTSITCKAITPPTLGSYVFYDVNKSIPLYVPAGSVEAYQTADQWKDFTNIIGLDDGDAEESNIRYIDPSNNELGSETVSLHLPDVPEIEGFTFLKWHVVAGDLEEGIIIQAVYQADESTSASSVYTNPANPAQKLIRNGNVYILSNEKTYSITGQEVIVP